MFPFLQIAFVICELSNPTMQSLQSWLGSAISSHPTPLFKSPDCAFKFWDLINLNSLFGFEACDFPREEVSPSSKKHRCQSAHESDERPKSPIQKRISSTIVSHIATSAIHNKNVYRPCSLAKSHQVWIPRELPDKFEYWSRWRAHPLSRLSLSWSA